MSEGKEGSVEEQYSCLSDRAILAHKDAGNIVIHPFKLENLATSSYDVSLGRFYYQEKDPKGSQALFNPYDEKHVRRLWVPKEAKTAWLTAEERNISFENVGENIGKEDYIIVLGPGETILAHTEEFIGGKKGITTMMKARSSLGRNFFAVCKCAGWGDVGYTNRWTMEITNFSRYYHIPLVVGRRVAQIIFFEVGGVLKDDYTKVGKYQVSDDLQKIIDTWTPDAMIPKMWKDREIKK